MFVTIFKTRAKPGHEGDVIALAEQWQQERRNSADGFQSGELLRNVKDPRELVWIARFESQEAAQANAGSPEQDAWYRQLVQLLEAVPTFTDSEPVRSL